MTASLNIAVIALASPVLPPQTSCRSRASRHHLRKSPKIGGVWAVAYPQVTLQTLRSISLLGFPLAFQPDLHPTGEQILRYLQAAVENSS